MNTCIMDRRIMDTCIINEWGLDMDNAYGGARQLRMSHGLRVSGMGLKLLQATFCLSCSSVNKCSRIWIWFAFFCYSVLWCKSSVVIL